jgi:hypothetical protein
MASGSSPGVAWCLTPRPREAACYPKKYAARCLSGHEKKLGDIPFRIAAHCRRVYRRRGDGRRR